MTSTSELMVCPEQFIHYHWSNLESKILNLSQNCQKYTVVFTLKTLFADFPPVWTKKIGSGYLH